MTLIQVSVSLPGIFSIFNRVKSYLRQSLTLVAYNPVLVYYLPPYKPFQGNEEEDANL